jgi:hypothetical protein
VGHRRLSSAATQVVQPVDNPLVRQLDKDRGIGWLTRVENTMIKLRAWQLLEYKSVVVLDNDLLCIRDVESFFAVDRFAAVPYEHPGKTVHVGDCLHCFAVNLGIIAVQPSQHTYNSLITALHEYKASTLDAHAVQTQGPPDAHHQGAA